MAFLLYTYNVPEHIRIPGYGLINLVLLEGCVISKPNNVNNRNNVHINVISLRVA